MPDTTFIGGGDNQWGTTPGGADPDWDTGFTPTQADNALLTVTSPSCTVENNAEFLSLNCTGYLNTLDCTNGVSINAYGDILFSGAMTYTDDENGGLTVFENCSLTSAGQTIEMGFTVSAGKDLTFVDNATLRNLQFAGAGSSLFFGTNVLTLTHASVQVELDFQSDTSVSYSGAAAIHFNPPPGDITNITCPTATLPSLVINAADNAGSINIGGQNLTCQSFTLQSGNVTSAVDVETLGNLTLTGGIPSFGNVVVGGNFAASNVSLQDGTYNVSGTAVSTGPGSISSATFTGTRLTATNTINGGGNSGVDFLYVFNGSTDEFVTNAANWTPNAVPDQEVNVNFSGAPGNIDNGNQVPSWKDIDFTGFSGALIDSIGGGVGWGQLNVYGSLTMSAGMTNSSPLILFAFAAIGTITLNGQVLAAINTSTEGGELTAGDDWTLTTYFETDNPTNYTVHLGSNKIQINLTAADDGNGFFPGPGTTYTWSAGGKLVANAGSGVNDFEFYFSEAPAVLPPVEINGPGRVRFYDQSTANPLAPMASLSVTGGEIDGSNLTASMNVLGSNTASNAVINNCDFSGGATMIATNCTGTGNINVTFVGGDTGASARGGAVGSSGFGF